MRIDSPAKMEKRLSDPSKSPRQNLSSPLSRKSKRRSSRKTNLLDSVSNTWTNDPRNDLAAGVGCPSRMLWQSTGVSQNVPGNGQRLFAAMSDPSVCGYSPMPLAYTMQPVSLPAMCRMYQPVPIPNVRSVPSRGRHRCNEHSVNVCPSANNNVANGCGNLQENRRLESTVHIAYQNGDYASLPPTANRDNGINGDELNSEHRRYSDPGLGPAENVPHLDSDDSDSADSGSSITTIGRSNKLVLSLVEQITELKKCNNQLFKELNEVKLNLEDIKVKAAQCKHSTPMDYQPGMLSDLIREIREANKNREEELAMKVKSLLEEKNNQQNQLSKLIKEKEESDQRITKLEEEVMALKMGATNEGREIAAFEEETLALRRELQEARASRNLAENHAAKCVNFAVSRSVTPVTFDTPCITSTPVRTALADTRSLPPVLPSAMSSHISSASSFSALRSRSAEVAALFVAEPTDHCRNHGLASCEDSPSTKNESDCSEVTPAPRQTAVVNMNDHVVNAVEIGPKNKIENQNSELFTYSATTKNFLEVFMSELADCLTSTDQRKACDINTARNDDKEKSSVTKERTQTNLSTTVVAAAEEQAGDQLPENCTEIKMTLSKKKIETKISVSPDVIIEERKDVSNKPRPSDKMIERSVDHTSWQRLYDFQRGSCKRSRRKKCELKRWLSETDKSSKSQYQDAKIPVDTTSSDYSSSTSRDTVNEQESCPNDNHTGRAITEVPEVAVVGGSSIMPKDLCSTGPLTSRTKTAPSRATYTTAYI
ncbi:hypothetical protein DMN91_008579 [Ooceraea biroi]|uniref:Uncharacterized protein n=1 Tax=Ooceraea biroi TaxID=2015173 RepID=A0A026WRI6_OOCBI|nr:uncharacterized protein LOC105276059 [Ooceraea biroi]EZA58617.1 hypothetical protein X777_14786 [Ooceraea biroi]RLU18223.1 hypothetical protein DMN91_008579 [Ooceraea biroi]